MVYSDFTIAELQRRFGLLVEGRPSQFADCPQVPVPVYLRVLMDRWLPLASKLNVEKAKSELIIAPILVELKLQYPDRLSVFSGIDFNVAPADGLVGRCDFVLANNPQQLEMTSPLCVIVEAKREDIVAGIPQCLAELVAAQRFNGVTEQPLYGVVSTGLIWRFLTLTGTTAVVDDDEYPIQHLDRIYSILTYIALG